PPSSSSFVERHKTDPVYLHVTTEVKLNALELNDTIAYMHSKKCSTKWCYTWIITPSSIKGSTSLVAHSSGDSSRAHENFSSCLATAKCFGVERYHRLHAFQKMFNKMVLYVDSCSSGSMFRDVLPSNMEIYLTTSSNEDEPSYSLFCSDKEIDVCLADEYSYVWVIDSEFNDLKTHTLEEQYTMVKKNTALSHVMKYGEMAMGSLPVGKFQGHYDLLMDRKDGAIASNAVGRKPSCQAHLFSKFRRLVEAATEDEHDSAWRKLHRELPLGLIVKEMSSDIVMDVTTQHKPTQKLLSKRDELVCFKAVFDQFRAHCFTIRQAS
ncbi:hypothetical protein T265_15711, partial [Opisthorchis viverrini]